MNAGARYDEIAHIGVVANAAHRPGTIGIHNVEDFRFMLLGQLILLGEWIFGFEVFLKG